jgi:acyl-ACP thioesterase
MTDPRAGEDEDPARSVTVAYRARFDECGPDGAVRSSAFLRYAQDLAWIHSERLGFGREWYAERNLAWVVRAVELAMLAPIPLGTTIRLTTRVSGFRKVWARRRTEGVDAAGAPVLWAHTDWVMTDTARGLPGRVPEAFPAAFHVPAGGFEPGRVPLPPTPDGARRHATTVRPQDIDPMGHVNNAAYVDYLEETLLATGGAATRLTTAIPRRIRIEYASPAAPGSDLVGEAWATDDDGGPGWAWRLRDGGGRELARARVDRGG